MERRIFLKASAAGLLGAGLAGGGAAFAGRAAQYRLEASAGEVALMPGKTALSPVMYYNRSLPGPLIRLRQGVESTIELYNALDQPTTVHWHGLRIDNAMDGVPGMTQDAVPPGGDFTYRFTPPDAGTYWYHTHNRSWEQLARGLSGILIVDEIDPPPVDRDLVFAIDDWRLDREGRFDEHSLGNMHDWSHGGRIGNFITVNGEVDKAYPVASGERIRLRLVNIANARVMRLQINQPNVHVVAIDGQPVTPFTPQGGQIRLAPGQRHDLVVDMTSDPGQVSPIELLIRDNAYQVAHFRFGDSAKREHTPDTPIALAPNPQNRVELPGRFESLQLAMQGGAMGGMRGAIFQGREMGIRELVQNGKAWAMNGLVGLQETPLFRVERGTAVSIEVSNDNNWPHAMHLHGHHFQRDGSPGTWRDTTLFERGESGSMRFVADNPGKWLLHCHMVEHMAGGMVTWFEVT